MKTFEPDAVLVTLTVAPAIESAVVDWLLERGGVPASHRVGVADLPRGDVEHAVDYYRRLCLRDPPRYRGRAPAAATPAGDPELAVAAEEIEECRRWLAGRGWQVTAVDFSQAGLDKAARTRLETLYQQALTQLDLDADWQASRVPSPSRESAATLGRTARAAGCAYRSAEIAAGEIRPATTQMPTPEMAPKTVDTRMSTNEARRASSRISWSARLTASVSVTTMTSPPPMAK